MNALGGFRMKRIITTFGDFHTGDEIADAVGRYGLALARIRDTDVVDVPFVTEDGTVDRLELRIGWLVDIGIARNGRAGIAVIEPETVEQLTDHALAIERSGVPSVEEDDAWALWEYEL